MKIKILFFYFFLFFWFYLDAVYIESIKWAQLWKGSFILIFIFLWIIKSNKRIKFLRLYLYMVLVYAITPLLFIHFKDVIVKIIEYLFFPSIFLFFVFLNRDKIFYFKVLNSLSIFFIISFIPFYFNLLPELGKVYDLELFGISEESGLTGLFQQPHASSQIIAYSTITLFFYLSKLKNLFYKFLITTIIFIGFYFQIKTYVRLGLLMTLIGFYFCFIYKTGLSVKIKFSIFFVLGLLITILIMQDTNSFDTFKMRLLGQSQWNDNSSASGKLDYDRVSSGRFSIWQSSINNLFVNDSFLEILFGITEPELQIRNKKTVNLAVFSHNGFIDVLVTNGLLGFLFLIKFLVYWIKLILRNLKKGITFEGKYALAIFFMFIISYIFQGGVIIYDGIFLSISIILMLFGNNTNKLVL